MKLIYTFAFSLFLIAFAQGQSQMNLPVNFEDNTVDYSVIGFEGAENSTIVADPTDAMNMVAKVIKSATAAAWAGTTLTNAAEEGFVYGVPFTTEITTISVSVWSPTANTPFLLKVEDSNDPTIFVETISSSGAASTWQTVTFNFANPAPNPSTINLANTYNKLSIFPNYGTGGPVAGEQTYYFDNFQMGEASSSLASNITFRLDMNDVTDNFTTPEVNGNFNNWCGNCAPMSDEDGDGVWELVIALEPGTYEYKFSFDAWAGQETLLPGSPCTMTTGPFTNRVLQVSEDTVLDVVCWASCAACGSTTGPYSVTFQVDMSQYSGTFTTPEVNGTFNNWCGSCAAMQDTDGDNIWQISIPLNAGSYDYKFSYDAWTGQELLTEGSACTTTIDGFTNRQLIVDGEVLLPAVCWQSCEACEVSVNEFTTSPFAVYPNPANQALTIERQNNTSVVNIAIYDMTGHLVYQNTLGANRIHTISTSDLANGIYEIALTSAKYQESRKVIVQH